MAEKFEFNDEQNEKFQFDDDQNKRFQFNDDEEIEMMKALIIQIKKKEKKIKQRK